MTLTTDRGKAFNASYAWAPVSMTGAMLAEITGDSRALSEIAADFEGVRAFTVEDENVGSAQYTGYTRLERIERTAAGVRVMLMKEE